MSRWTVQVLIDLKSADPTALTAEEAIRHLLGLDQALESLRRRVLHEVVLEGAGRGDPTEAFHDYMLHTMLLWNANKHRAALRTAPEAGSGAPRSWLLEGESLVEGKKGEFGRPPLSDPENEHLLIWPREGESAPADLALPGWSLRGYARGEIYSLRWRGGTKTERARWTDEVAVCRNRGVGLLVNPHAQVFRRSLEDLPIPAFPTPR